MTRRLWGAAGGGAAVLLAAGAFLAWSSIGIGPGPLDVAFVASTGTVPGQDPAIILVPVVAAASTPAVIDSIELRGGGGHPPPPLLRVIGDPDQACAGIWWPVARPGGFAQRCARDGTGPLIGRIVPVRRPAVTASGHTGAAARAIEVGMEVAAPGSSGCWSVTQVVIRYHVGSRHYATAADESLSGCTASARLAPGGRATAAPTATTAAPAATTSVP